MYKNSKYTNVKRLLFDIETKVFTEALKYLPEPTAPGNLKDPEKIAVAIADKKQEQIDKAPLDPDLCQVVAISMRVIPGGRRHVAMAGHSHTPNERALLRLFWNTFADCSGNAIGFNILAFDFPVLLRRSFALGIREILRPNLAKYQQDPITDLYGILYNWQPGRGLKWVAKRYGIDNPYPDLDGSKVATMPYEVLRTYAMNDLRMTEELFNKMQGLYF